MKENSQPTEGQELRSHLLDTANEPINPVLILAEILAKRGYSIQVEEQLEGESKDEGNKVAVFVGGEAKGVFEKTVSTPEILSLHTVLKGGDFISVLLTPNDRILFDPQAMKKLRALNLMKLASKLRLSGGDNDPTAKHAEKRAREQLNRGLFRKPLRPLDVSDMKSLVEKVVDRELASTA